MSRQRRVFRALAAGPLDSAMRDLERAAHAAARAAADFRAHPSHSRMLKVMRTGSDDYLAAYTAAATAIATSAEAAVLVADAMGVKDDGDE